MQSAKDIFTLTLLTLVYLVSSVRYFPGSWGRTISETLYHLLAIAPLTVGGTILFVSFFQRTAGGKMPWDRVLRIFLMLAIMAEFFFGLEAYLSKELAG